MIVQGHVLIGIYLSGREWKWTISIYRHLNSLWNLYTAVLTIIPRPVISFKHKEYHQKSNVVLVEENCSFKNIVGNSIPSVFVLGTTICPRNSGPLYVGSYYIKWVTTFEHTVLYNPE